MKGKSFIPGAVHHIYQRSFEGYLIFYSARDMLVFFSIASITAKRYRITILDISLMFDHIHLLVIAHSKREFDSFKRDLIRDYSLVFTRSHGLQGPVFETPGGFAAKVGDKKVRTSIAYLFNNQVEKKLCARAEEWPWNFLAYYRDNHPYSQKIIRSRVTRPMRRALEEVDRMARHILPLNHTLLRRIIAPLTPKEIKQLTDYIVSKYNRIDYERIISYYGTYDSMLTAIHSNTGSEHDLNESFTPGSDKVYLRLIEKAHSWLGFASLRELLLSPVEIRKQALERLFSRGWATREQARKFLRIPRAQRETNGR